MPTCKIPADAQPMTPQQQCAATNAPKLLPIHPPMHYPQHAANADKRKPSDKSKASAAAPPPPNFALGPPAK